MPLLVALEVVCYHISAGFAIVRVLILGEYLALNRSFFTSKCYCSFDERNQFCDPGRSLAHYWRLGRLWSMEVCSLRSKELSIHLTFYSRPNITIFFTLLAVTVSFAWLGVEDASKWEAGVALYILGCEFST